MTPTRLLHGQLFAAEHHLHRDNLLTASWVRLERSLRPTHWDEYRYMSRVPLRGEVQYPIDYYEYVVLCRRSGPRVLLAAESQRIVELITRQHNTARTKEPRLRKLHIAVDALVRHLVAQPRPEYSLSRVDAQVASALDSLRALTFYGDSVEDAALFRDALDRIRCHGCGLRMKATARELLRLTNTGGVSFRFSGSRSVKLVEEALHVVSSLGFLKFMSEESTPQP